MRGQSTVIWNWQCKNRLWVFYGLYGKEAVIYLLLILLVLCRYLLAKPRITHVFWHFLFLMLQCNSPRISYILREKISEHKQRLFYNRYQIIQNNTQLGGDIQRGHCTLFWKLEGICFYGHKLICWMYLKWYYTN